MPFVPATKVVMAEFRAVLDGEKVENTMYFQFADVGPSVAQMQTLGETLRDAWIANALPQLPPVYAFTEMYLTNLTTQTSPTVSVAVPAGQVGGIASPALPNSVTLCTSFRTAGRGRASRGRLFWPALTEPDVTGNVVSTARANGILGAIVAVVAAAETGGLWSHVVVSRFLNGVPRASALIQVVTSYVQVDSYVDSQRRRLPGRGR